MIEFEPASGACISLTRFEGKEKLHTVKVWLIAGSEPLLAVTV